MVVCCRNTCFLDKALVRKPTAFEGEVDWKVSVRINPWQHVSRALAAAPASLKLSHQLAPPNRLSNLVDLMAFVAVTISWPPNALKAPTNMPRQCYGLGVLQRPFGLPQNPDTLQ